MNGIFLFLILNFWQFDRINMGIYNAGLVWKYTKAKGGYFEFKVREYKKEVREWVYNTFEDVWEEEITGSSSKMFAKINRFNLLVGLGKGGILSLGYYLEEDFSYYWHLVKYSNAIKEYEEEEEGKGGIYSYGITWGYGINWFGFGAGIDMVNIKNIYNSFVNDSIKTSFDKNEMKYRGNLAISFTYKDIFQISNIFKTKIKDELPWKNLILIKYSPPSRSFLSIYLYGTFDEEKNKEFGTVFEHFFLGRILLSGGASLKYLKDEDLWIIDYNFNTGYSSKGKFIKAGFIYSGYEFKDAENKRNIIQKIDYILGFAYYF